jgi:putative transposase
VGGFAYVAVILDAWSRRAVGSAISRSIDVPLTLAALNAAVEMRKPPRGYVHHSDRGVVGVVGAAADPYVSITFR